MGVTKRRTLTPLRAELQSFTGGGRCTHTHTHTCTHNPTLHNPSPYHTVPHTSVWGIHFMPYAPPPLPENLGPSFLVGLESIPPAVGTGCKRSRGGEGKEGQGPITLPASMVGCRQMRGKVWRGTPPWMCWGRRRCSAGRLLAPAEKWARTGCAQSLSTTPSELQKISQILRGILSAFLQ